MVSEHRAPRPHNLSEQTGLGETGGDESLTSDWRVVDAELSAPPGRRKGGLGGVEQCEEPVPDRRPGGSAHGHRSIGAYPSRTPRSARRVGGIQEELIVATGSRQYCTPEAVQILAGTPSPFESTTPRIDTEYSSLK
jgi:hypothetical protein